MQKVSIARKLDQKLAAVPEQQASFHRKRSLWISCALGALLLCIAIVLKIADRLPSTHTVQIVVLWLVGFVPYLAACLLVLLNRRRETRWRRLELWIILLGALLLRVLLLFTAPDFSGDAWRYLWDARVTLQGFSPYVYVPNNPLLVPFHDALVYGQMGYHTVPTLYPPAAQGIYLVSYLLAPSNIVMLKTIFMGFDLISCVLLMILLKRKGLDPARSIIYAWCPLPIVEFATQGHIDVVMITFILAMLVCAQSRWRGARVLTGLFLGLATLTKLYPIVLLVVVLRRRDYALVLTCLLTIIAGYIPYYILGHGHVFGFFSSYLKQIGGNAGPILLLVHAWEKAQALNQQSISHVQTAVDAALVGAVGLVVLVLRWRERISMEAATLLLLGTIYAISSFVYPWYVTALLPWVALLIGPLWLRTQHGRVRLNAHNVAILGVWYFVCTVHAAYFFLGRTFDWTLYYILVYGVVCALLLLAALAGLHHWRSLRHSYG